MAGLGLEDLPLPPRRYDLARWQAAFETEDEAEREDTLVRAPNVLEQSFAGGRLINRRSALDLGKLLSHWSTPPSLASSRHMRDLRRRVIGAIWQLHDDLGNAAGTTFHLIPEGSMIRSADLMSTDARLRKGLLRTQLNRAFAAQSDGAIIAFLHGEYDVRRDRFCLHWHGYATGGKISAIDSLRSKGAYRRAVDSHEGLTAKRPIVVTRDPLADLPRPLSYMLKSYWSAETSPVGEGDASRDRTQRTHRIPEPYHSLALLWLNQWRLTDVALLMGVRVTRQGLSISNSQRVYTNGD